MTPFSPTAATSTIFIIRLRAAISICRFRLAGEILQGLPAHTADSPFVHDLCADRFVECNSRRVPIEHRPFKARVTVRGAMLGESRQQRLADAAAAKRRPYEKVFKIEAVPPAEGGKIQKPDRQSRRRSIPLCDIAKNLWRRREQCLGNLHFV